MSPQLKIFIVCALAVTIFLILKKQQHKFIFQNIYYKKPFDGWG